MSSVQIVMDTAMCMLWMLTYTLVLVGTKKYCYPLISPITQAIIAPLEWSCLFLFFRLNAGFNYAYLAYLYWAMIEIAIFREIEKLKYIQKNYIKLYIAMVLTITLVMIYFVGIREKMLFFNYFNTFLGIATWFQFVWMKRDYPIKMISLIIFITKFAADILAGIVYYGDGSWTTNMLCILLPIFDFLFIIIWFTRRLEKSRGVK